MPVDVNPRLINAKTGVWYIILLFDLVMASFVELSFGVTLKGEKDIYQVIAIFMQPSLFFEYLLTAQLFYRIQLATQGVMLLWFLFMFWSTFLLKFGLIGILVKQFRWTFIYLIVQVTLTCAERIFRFVKFFAFLFLNLISDNSQKHWQIQIHQMLQYGIRRAIVWYTIYVLSVTIY